MSTQPAAASCASSPGRGRAQAPRPAARVAPPPDPARRRCSATPRSSATRASSCCPSGARPPSARCATRACWSSAPARSARRSRCTWPARAWGGSGSSTPTRSSSPTCTASYLHYTPDIGRAEGRVRRRQARLPQPGDRGRDLPGAARRDNAAGLVEGQDLVIDCTRLVRDPLRVNAACCAARIPLVEGGVPGWSGLVMAVRPGERVLPLRVPEPSRRTRRRAPTAGVLGPGRRGDRLAAGARGAEAADRRGEPLMDAFLHRRPRDAGTCA